ncbi:MAG: hypothetical protein Q7K16_02050 [Candidatus Azambacteria bacterium]|nr:hypothetical protein [Candidatus Azambacteria bacterium]
MSFNLFKKTKATPEKSEKGMMPISWYRSITHQYFFTQVCLALEEIGFFNECFCRDSVSINEFAKTRDVSLLFLKTCVDFLWSTTDILESDGDIVRLKNKNFPKSLWGLLAYKPVFDNLAEMLKKEKKYGRDVFRDGYYLQKASVLLSGDAVHLALAALKKEKSGQLVDFGCGAAHSLIDYCRHDSSRTSLGIDTNSDIARAARKNVEEAGLRDRVVIVESDALDFSKWQPFIREEQPQYFLASTMLHEFLRDGEEFVINFLAKIKSDFPDSQFFIIEFDALPFEKIKTEADMERKLFAAMYELWHPLTNQGMPQPREVWEKIIKKSGWKIKNISRANMNVLIYHCEQ